MWWCATPRRRRAPPPTACCPSSTPRRGAEIRGRSLDSQSAGVAAQAALREGAADDGYAEANLWTGIGRARSGCGAAIVGDPDQVLAKLQAYRDLGIEAFILSGYPHAAEADLFARHVLPRLDHGPTDAGLRDGRGGRAWTWQANAITVAWADGGFDLSLGDRLISPPAALAPLPSS